MTDITNPKLIYAKAALFVCGGVLASALLIWEHPTVKIVVLLAIAVWCFARAYYFAFYVLEHYVDPGFHYSGLWSLARYLLRSRGSARPPTMDHQAPQTGP